MTEENQVQASGANQAGDAAAQVPAGGTGAVADWASERLKAEKRNKILQKELESLRSQIAEAENAKKTEHEKALDAARKSAAEEVETRLRGEQMAKDIRTEIRLALVSSGVPENQAAVIIAESSPESVEDAKAAAIAYAERWKAEIARPVQVPGQGGVPPARNQSGPPRPWTVESMNAYAMQHGHAALLKHNAEILQDLGKV